MYKALTSFTDLQDANYRYQAGDIFPRKGLKVSEGRIKELLTDQNRRHQPMIEEIEKPKKEEVKEVKEEKSAPAKKSASGRKKADAK